MGVISVRLDNETEARLKREAQEKGVTFSAFLREKLTESKQEVDKLTLKEMADMLDNHLRLIGDFLSRMERENNPNIILLHNCIHYGLQSLLPKDNRQAVTNAMQHAQKKTKEFFEAEVKTP